MPTIKLQIKMVPITYYFNIVSRGQTRMQLTYSSYALSTETFVTMSQCLSSYDKTLYKCDSLQYFLSPCNTDAVSDYTVRQNITATDVKQVVGGTANLAPCTAYNTIWTNVVIPEPATNYLIAATVFHYSCSQSYKLKTDDQRQCFTSCHTLITYLWISHINTIREWCIKTWQTERERERERVGS